MSTVLIDALSNPATAFTPTLAFGGASVGMTYAVGGRSGIYVRVGSLIFFTININLTAKGSSTGSATVTGLPFVAANIGFAPVSTYFDSLSSVAGELAALVVQSTPTINLYQLATGTSAALTNANFNNGSSVFLSGVYSV